jgi:Sec-independent protein translocase protein TatA/GNAT superfamily N-acetyltransferase
VFGIDLETLIILAVLAFILFGPEKLPEYAGKLGRLVAKLRQSTAELSQHYQNPFNQPPETSPETPVPPPAAIPAPESACPLCRQPVALGFTFCPKCGHRLPREDYNQPSEPLQTAYPLIRPLADDEIDRALAIINQAALAYKGVIPADCWHEPYMPEAELRAEIAAGVNFWGYETEGRLVGVIGRQDLKDVTLIRHAYIDPEAQRRGVGSKLLNHLLDEIPGPVLVGTWAAAWWAIRFYEKHGFRLLPQVEKDRLLRTYWTISPRQVETSVVLADPKWVTSVVSG